MGMPYYRQRYTIQLSLILLYVFSIIPNLRGQEMSTPELVKAYCAACHQVDKKGVGPSFVEIASIYKDNPAGIVLWSSNPGKKRPETIQMPSMAFLGDKKLNQIAQYIIQEAKGKKEVEGEVANTIPTIIEPARPKVQRVFMPDASPASIAVALPGKLSYCWDATTCRLRYVWKGQFIDPWPVWRGNGNGLATIKGQIIYSTGDPGPTFRGGKSSPKFLGYRLINGIPEFKYRVGADVISELIIPLPDDSGLTQIFSINGTSKSMVLDLPESEKVKYSFSAGSLNDDQNLSLTSSGHQVFSLTTQFVNP